MDRRCLIGLAALALAACGGAPPAPKPEANGLRYGRLAFTPCALTAMRQSVEAQCATLQVPEDHDRPDGRRIGLALAWIPARGEPTEDPIVFIAGGPGQSAREAYPLLHDALADARRTRHVLLVDARGTGGSHRLQCDPDEGLEALLESSAEANARFAADCRKALAAKADLRRYTTTDHVRDLERVRAAVGAPRLNLLGVSYGTRVAQQYAKRYPHHVRTVTLDSVVPNALVLGQEHARNLDAALQAQFARCRADVGCRRNLGDPAAHLAALRTRLQQGGLAPVRYRDPVDGQWREEVPRYGHLAALLRLYAYQPQAAAVLPWLLHEAAQGRYESLLAQSRLLYADLGDAIALGMQLSVMCTEDVPELREDPADADSVLGTEFVTFARAQCSQWPRGRRPADFRAPLRGDLPVLAISGEYDPVTPPRYGDEVIRHLRNGRHLVLPGQGHSVLTVGCMPKLFAQFLERADARSLDASCLQRLQPVPPFAGAYGWEP